MTKEKATTAAAALDKEQTRLLIQQGNGFLKIFGGAHPRLKATSIFLDALTESVMWGKLWAIFETNPTLMSSLSSVVSLASGDMESSPNDAISTCRQFYADQGMTPPEGFDKLAEIVEAPSAQTQAEKEKFRRGIAAALATIQMWAYFLGSKSLQGYVNFMINLFVNHFDEVWAIEHPEDE